MCNDAGEWGCRGRLWTGTINPLRKIGNDARNIPSYSRVDLSSAAELRLSPESLIGCRNQHDPP